MQTSAVVLMVWHVGRCQGTGTGQACACLEKMLHHVQGSIFAPMFSLRASCFHLRCWCSGPVSWWTNSLSSLWRPSSVVRAGNDYPILHVHTITGSQACCPSISCSQGRGAVTHLQAVLLWRPGRSAEAADRADVGAGPRGRSAPSLLPALWTKLSRQYRWPAWTPITAEQGAGTLAVPSPQPVGHWGQIPGSHMSVRAALEFPHPGKK